MRMIHRLFLLSLITLAACTQAPTKVYESIPTTAKQNLPVVDDNTVIIDARPAFQYALSHLNSAQNLQWSDFSQRESPFYGELEKDLFFHARRLARLGIDPSTKVIVVGLGSEGHGEEGRIAWTFKVMGIKDVSFMNLSNFSIPMTNTETEPKESKPIWKPQVDSSLMVDKKTFLKAATSTSVVIIDVRSHQEYLKEKSNLLPKLINIPWTDFFDSRGLVKPEMKHQLEEVGITSDKTLYVISEKGVESAAVTLALRDLGYKKAANFAGGYLELFADLKH